jgi:hypothetical protein
VSLKIHIHGGLCCGIKTIVGFGSGDTRNYPEPELLQQDKPGWDWIIGDYITEGVGCDRVMKNFYHGKALPKNQTKIARLDAYLEWLKKERPQHIIEVALAGGDQNQFTAWEPELLSRGFKLSVVAKNSNSGNPIKVFHLVLGTAPDNPCDYDADADPLCSGCQEEREYCCCLDEED